MKTLTKLILGMAVAAGLAAVANANSVYVTRIGGYFSGSGGEFSLNFANPVNPAIDLSKYVVPDGAIWVGVGGTRVKYYESFCVEEHVSIVIPGWYDYTVSNASIPGGPGAVGGKDPISLGTAYLFSQFAKGWLAGYDYTPGAGRMASAGELQQAIWWLEDEITLVNPLLNPFILAVDTRFHGGEKADNNGLYDVAVANLTTVDGAHVQDQLVLVPDGGATMAFLGIGLIALAAIRRRIF